MMELDCVVADVLSQIIRKNRHLQPAAQVRSVGQMYKLFKPFSNFSLLSSMILELCVVLEVSVFLRARCRRAELPAATATARAAIGCLPCANAHFRRPLR